MKHILPFDALNEAGDFVKTVFSKKTAVLAILAGGFLISVTQLKKIKQKIALATFRLRNSGAEGGKTRKKYQAAKWKLQEDEWKAREKMLMQKAKAEKKYAALSPKERAEVEKKVPAMLKKLER